MTPAYIKSFGRHEIEVSFKIDTGILVIKPHWTVFIPHPVSRRQVDIIPSVTIYVRTDDCIKNARLTPYNNQGQEFNSIILVVKRGGLRGRMPPCVNGKIPNGKPTSNGTPSTLGINKPAVSPFITNGFNTSCTEWKMGCIRLQVSKPSNRCVLLVVNFNAIGMHKHFSLLVSAFDKPRWFSCYKTMNQTEVISPSIIWPVEHLPALYLCKISFSGIGPVIQFNYAGTKIRVWYGISRAVRKNFFQG
jgi:hypothetical protein